MKKLVLIVDDDVMNIKTIQAVLETDYRVATALTGPLALRILERITPDIVLIDVNMPDMNGFEFLESLKMKCGKLPFPVIFVSAEHSSAIESRALDAGAEDFIARPFSPALLKARVDHTLERHELRVHFNELLQTQTQALIGSTLRANEIQKNMLIMMASLIESRDGSSGDHIRRVEQYMKIFVDAIRAEGYQRDLMTDEYMDALCKAAYIHDIGKLCVNDAVLQKQGDLTDAEFEQIKYHTTSGGEMIRSAMADSSGDDYLRIARDVATYHHERWDGSGYPKGLMGDSIPLSARIMALVDVFDVLSAGQCYRQAFSLKQTFEIMGNLAGEQFDPVLVQIFLKHKQEFAKLAESLGCRGGNDDE
ncbi:MAG: HD-GYP domain-containing protein [Oscillospiraceae bacterium]